MKALQNILTWEAKFVEPCSMWTPREVCDVGQVRVGEVRLDPWIVQETLIAKVKDDDGANTRFGLLMLIDFVNVD